MKSLFRNVCFAALTALCAVVLAACEDDDTKSGDLQLFYPTVVDIGPSMNFVSGTPTYYGPAPSNFSIAGITLDDKAFTSECFSIGADTGMVSISNTDALDPGTYKLTIACQAGGGAYRFENIFVVRMVSATPDAIEVSEPTLVIPYAELETTEASVTVAPVGESVSILNYSLVQAEGFEYFTISKDGVVTYNAEFTGEVMPGSYPLPVKIETYAGSATYENLLTARITSEPLEVRYPSASGRMEYNMAFQGSTPSLKGSPDEVVWAIKQVIPAEGTDPTDKIKIDPATGVVSVDAGSELPIDASYTLDLTVKNSFGSTDFDGAYTLSVIEFIAPIESDKFGYEAAVRRFSAKLTKGGMDTYGFAIRPSGCLLGKNGFYYGPGEVGSNVSFWTPHYDGVTYPSSPGGVTTGVSNYKYEPDFGRGTSCDRAYPVRCLQN